MDVKVFEYSSNKHGGAFEKIFQILDNEIIDCKFNFIELRRIYDEWSKCLKKKMGTSAGFTGLSEYIVLKSIFLYLEQNFKIRFDVQKKTNDVNFFVSKDKRILITHGISINKEMGKVVNKEFGKSIINWSFSNKIPDIVVFKSNINVFSPEAIIQVKVYYVSPSIIRNEAKTIKGLLSSNKSLCSIIFFYQPPKEIESELKRYFNFVITPESHNFLGMLQEIGVRLR